MRKLSDDELAACHALGVKPEEYLAQLDKDSEFEALQEGGDISIRDVARNMGIKYETDDMEQ